MASLETRAPVQLYFKSNHPISCANKIIPVHAHSSNATCRNMACSDSFLNWDIGTPPLLPKQYPFKKIAVPMPTPINTNHTKSGYASSAAVLGFRND